ncbi:MAG TPA: 23S rRNA (uracil(1939)-C(5))-methyltransferase RlmD [Candidatus Izemoplasmatales bacterium]|nr:23S rRNA (uracil(1939)-C(5))-methyltransferase RlmD [Candidatus Izemoplasmatales bacterium]
MPENYQAENINDDGYAVIITNRKKYLVPNLLPHEEAEIRFFNSGFGKVLNRQNDSKDRIKPLCPYFNECGGCQLQHISYDMQKDLKTAKIKHLLANAGIDETLLLPIIGMKDPFHYRNKAQMVLSSKGKRVMAGFYAENTHEIINVDKCVVQSDTANDIVKSCRDLMQKMHLEPYDEDKKTGLIRHVFVRTAEETKQVLVAIVTAREMFPGRHNFVQALKEKHPDITTIVQNVNPKSTSMVLGNFERILYGPGYIIDTILGKKFKISANTFYQVNHKQAEVLYQKALELVKPKKEDNVLELYSGIGAIGVILADHVRKVTGVEINKDSVKNAIQNARINNMKNIRFYQMDAAEFVDTLDLSANRYDLIVVDPPREGLSKQTLEGIKKIHSENICYISCDPDTLVRDMSYLVKNGYSVKKIQPVDMFPQTNHVEAVAVLVLKK